jgi:hypothetical protein
MAQEDPGRQALAGSQHHTHHHEAILKRQFAIVQQIHRTGRVVSPTQERRIVTLSKMARVSGRIGVITACCVQVTACGFLFTKGPPDDYESMNYFTCSEGKVGPTLDLVYAAYIVASIGFVNGETASNVGVSPGKLKAIYGAEGLLWGTSGLVGYGKVNNCRDAKQDLADRLSSGKKPRSSWDSKETKSPFSWATGGVSSLRLITPAQATTRNAPNGIQWTGLRPLNEDLTSQASARR